MLAGTPRINGGGTSSGGTGTVTSITAGTGITLTPNPITTTGTVALTIPVVPSSGGTGTTTVFTQGSVVFAGASGVYTQDNTNLFWDDTNNRLGIGTASPTVTLDVRGHGNFFSGVTTLGMGIMAGSDSTHAVRIGYFNSNNVAVWPAGVTASTTNYGFLLANDGNNVQFNATTTVQFNLSDTAKIVLSTTKMIPATNDGIALGDATHNYSDLFLASGAVINFNNGDATITHSSGALTTVATTFGITGNLKLTTAGNGIYVKEGSNATMGTGTLSGGTATISTTKVTASSRVFLTDTGGGVLANIGALYVGTVTAGTSFVVNSSNALDSSNFNWIIFEPA